jgi:BASS family bile acid:Na+ symporter
MIAAEMLGPLMLFLLMTVVGLELTIADFKRVFSTPAAVIVGTLAQIVLLPAMTIAVVWALDVNPVFGAGAILVAVSPGAGMSNILAAVAGANVALSVTLTAAASVLSVVTLPIVASFGMSHFIGEGAPVDVPVGDLILQLILTLLVPIGVGMWLRSRYRERAEEIAPKLQRWILALIGILIGVMFMVVEQDQMDLSGAGIAFVAAGVWTLCAMAIGWIIATALRLDLSDRVTFVIEFSARNVAVASIVAMSGLGRMDLTLFSGVYFVVGYPLSILVAVWHRRRTGRGIKLFG